MNTTRFLTLIFVLAGLASAVEVEPGQPDPKFESKEAKDKFYKEAEERFERDEEERARREAAEGPPPPAAPQPALPPAAKDPATAKRYGELLQRAMAFTWIVNAKPSPIDDSLSVSLTLLGMKPDDLSADYDNYPVLVLRSREGKVEVVCAAKGLVYASRPGPMTLRWGAEKAVVEQWGEADGEFAMFSPEPKKFIRKALASSYLVVRFDSATRRVTALFDLSTLDAAIKPYAARFGLDEGAASRPLKRARRPLP